MIRFLLDWWPVISAIVGVIGVGGVLLLLGLWPVVSSFLIGTKLGRTIAFAGGVMLAVLWVFVSGVNRGERKERAKQKARQQRIAADKVKKDEEIRNLPRSELRRRLNRWVRD